MRNYMKTIISALQAWTSSEIKENNVQTDEKINAVNNKFNKNISDLDNKINHKFPDWNENDSSASGYIKNRPFYEETKWKVYIPEQTINMVETRYGYEAQYDGESDIPEDQYYRVTFDGIVYENIESTGDYGLEFWVDDKYVRIIPWTMKIESEYINGQHTIKVDRLETTLVRLDSKFAPFDVSYDEVEYSIAFNPFLENTATGYAAFAVGKNTTASAYISYAEGCDTTASGDMSHAEGNYTTASGSYSHAEGNMTTASGWHSHAEGGSTTASGEDSHAEGCLTIASGECQHAQGKANIEDTENKYAHIVGNGKSSRKRSNAHTLDWSGNAWYSGIIKLGGTSYDDAFEVALKSDIVQSDWTENDETAAGYIKNRPFYEETGIIDVIPEQEVELSNGIVTNFDVPNIVYDNLYYLTINGVTLTGTWAYMGNPVYDYYLEFDNGASLMFGTLNLGSEYTELTTATIRLYTEGTTIYKIDKKYLPDLPALDLVGTKIDGGGEAFNLSTGATGYGSHAEGSRTIASGVFSHAEGDNTTASGRYSHAEGKNSIASEECSHAEGKGEANGAYSHAEGAGTATGYGSHAEGNGEANGMYSHAEGSQAIANKNYSHAEGYKTIASSEYQHVQGKLNIEDAENKYAHIVGNGIVSTDSRSNAHTINWNGVGWFAGGLQVGGNAQDDGAENVATQSYVTSAVTSALASYYLKTETYTQEEVNALVSTIPKFAIQPVDALPIADISSTTVYLLTTGDESENLYTEYIYVNNTWEKLGTQKLDLSGYALKTELPTKLSNLENDALDYIILKSSTEGSTKRFKITIDDSGILTSTELTE